MCWREDCFCPSPPPPSHQEVIDAISVVLFITTYTCSNDAQ